MSLVGLEVREKFPGGGVPGPHRSGRELSGVVWGVARDTRAAWGARGKQF